MTQLDPELLELLLKTAKEALNTDHLDWHTEETCRNYVKDHGPKNAESRRTEQLVSYARNYNDVLKFESGKPKPKRASPRPSLPPLGPENEQFKAHLRQNPHDYSGHLAYSDYLRENGRNTEADFRKDFADWLQGGYHETKSDDPEHPWSVRHDSDTQQAIGRFLNGEPEPEPAKLPGQSTVADLPGFRDGFTRQSRSGKAPPPGPIADTERGVLRWPSFQAMSNDLQIAYLMNRLKSQKPKSA